MNAATRAVEVFLWMGVISALICCVGVVAMKELYERLHYMSTVTTISITCILVAVVIHEGWGQATIKTVLIMLVLLMINAVLTHATARAARIRTLGDWMPEPGKNVPTVSATGKDEESGEDQAQRQRQKNES